MPPLQSRGAQENSPAVTILHAMSDPQLFGKWFSGSSWAACRVFLKANIREALEFHVEGLREEGYSIPEPKSYSSYIKIPA